MKSRRRAPRQRESPTGRYAIFPSPTWEKVGTKLRHCPWFAAARAGTLDSLTGVHKALEDRAMKRIFDEDILKRENDRFAGSGGCSHGSRRLGFKPAFLDFATQTIHLSRFADGRPAPIHVLDGLPDEVVVTRSLSGRVVAAKPTLISGFERNGFFYTRTAAARALAQWDADPDHGQRERDYCQRSTGCPAARRRSARCWMKRWKLGSRR